MERARCETVKEEMMGIIRFKWEDDASEELF